MKPKLLILQPSHYRAKDNRALYKARKRSVVPLTLPYLAALTPADWQVTLVDEQTHDIPFGEHFDVVAISVLTLNSLRAYDVADEFRKRGVPVIMGGPHTYFHSQEAGAHCDAVGIGEAEGVWTQMLDDALSQNLKPVYKAPLLESLAGLPMPRYELMDLRRYRPFRTFAVVSSRGCPFKCDFCSERFLLGEHYRCRPVPEVIDEIRQLKCSSIFFGDSNFGGSRAHAMQLMEAMIPLRLRWSALWASYLCNDKEFMDMAQRSGLLHLNIGVESIDAGTLASMNKRFNKAHKYAAMLQDLRKRGISYSLNFIFGFDNEPENACQNTLQFLRQHKVPVAYFNILTPVKGTPFFDRMHQAGRILDTSNIDRWPGQICYIKPTRGTPKALEENIQRMYREFYSLPSMLSRLSFPVTQSHIASWVINLSQRKVAQRSDTTNNFDDY